MPLCNFFFLILVGYNNFYVYSSSVKVVAYTCSVNVALIAFVPLSSVQYIELTTFAIFSLRAYQAMSIVLNAIIPLPDLYTATGPEYKINRS